MGGKFTRTRVWERFYVAIPRDRAFTAPIPKEPQNRQSADIARKRRSTSRLQTDARPSLATAPWPDLVKTPFIQRHEHDLRLGRLGDRTLS